MSHTDFYRNRYLYRASCYNQIYYIYELCTDL